MKNKLVGLFVIVISIASYGVKGQVSDSTYKVQQSNEGDTDLGIRIDGTDEYDNIGNGSIFGRKVIYGDVSAAKEALNVSGIVSIKICINRKGEVIYVEINNTETTIKDRATLKKFLTAARKYKFQPDVQAPKEQCGKLLFTNQNSVKH